MRPAVDTEAICEQCIWNLDHAGLARTGPCDRSSWAGSVQQELLEHSIRPSLTGETGPFPAYERCAAITMIKDEADIIHANLSWLHHIGVRRFLTLDNDSIDGTLDEIARFRDQRPDASLAVLRDPTVAYYQSDKMTGLAQTARQLWPDVEWLLPVDADELLISRHGLRALAYVPEAVQALTVPKTIHFLHADMPPNSSNVLANMPIRSGLFVVPPKVIIRARPDLGVTQGNHKARSADGRSINYQGGFQYGFYYREFQTRSFEHFAQGPQRRPCHTRRQSGGQRRWRAALDGMVRHLDQIRRAGPAHDVRERMSAERERAVCVRPFPGCAGARAGQQPCSFKGH